MRWPIRRPWPQRWAQTQRHRARNARCKTLAVMANTSQARATKVVAKASRPRSAAKADVSAVANAMVAAMTVAAIDQKALHRLQLPPRPTALTLHIPASSPVRTRPAIRWFRPLPQTSSLILKLRKEARKTARSVNPANAAAATATAGTDVNAASAMSSPLTALKFR